MASSIQGRVIEEGVGFVDGKRGEKERVEGKEHGRERDVATSVS
jgi:hypothetical protein